MGASTFNILEVNNLCAGYVPDSPVLLNVALRLTGGQVLAVLGKNGAGKSTLLKALVGLCPFVCGDVTWNGHDISHMPVNARSRMGVSFVHQGGRVFGPMTVAENLRVGCTRINGSKAKRAGMSASLEQFPVLRGKLSMAARDLSGGEKQLLSIATALAAPAKILLLDEPLLGLDDAVRDQILEVIQRFAACDGGIAVIAEQQEDAARRIATQTIRIEGGEIQGD